MKQRIEIPNDINSFVIEELRERLLQGIDVTIAFGGNSMLPLIDGNGDTIVLRNVSIEEPMRRGNIYLFAYQGHCVVHRLLRSDGDHLVFRGDNCFGMERVSRDAVIARVVTVVKKDGSRESCDDVIWRRRSFRVAAFRTIKNNLLRCFGRNQRRWERWAYLVALLLLMWAPVGVLGVPLNNFVFGIRMDHLLHASVYLPCVFFLMDFKLLQPLVRSWLVAVVIGLTAETVQYFLPYRGFDINDMVANFLGVTLGYFVIMLLKRRSVK